MNFKKYHVSKNLFDYQTMAVSKSGYALTADGSESSNSQWSISDYIPINGSNFVLSKVGGNSFAICFYNANKQYVYGQAYATGSPSSKQSIICDVGTEVQYARFSYISDSASLSYDNIATIMLNTGLQPLPYEPYSSEVWHDIPHYIHKTSTDTLTTLPADIYANDTTATVGLKGQMEQSGIPTPTTPIQPSECGERTGNLFDYTVSESGTITSTGVLEPNVGCWRSTIYYEIDETKTYRASKAKNVIRICYYDSSKTFISREQILNENNKIITIPSGAKYIKWVLYSETGIPNLDAVEAMKIMLSEGAEIISYEPYGYKIPILSGGTTTPVYLGEVESTRRIKKLVLTGTETFGYANSCLTLSFDGQSSSLQPVKTIILCDRYFGVEPKYRDQLYNYQCCITRNYNQIAIRDDNYADTDAWKTYLQQQYAAGTPVTVWYVLATETTGIVNEPLRKIDNYADTVSGITIPTIAGANTISVDTTLQPSEVTVNYKGWHPVQSVHEKSKNLFDISTVEKGRIDNGEVGYTSQTSSLTIEGGTVSFTTTAVYRGVCSGFFEIPDETETITFNFITNEALGVKFVFYDSIKTWLNQDYTPTLQDIPPATANIPSGAKYVRLSFTGQITGGYSYTMSNIMLNTGSTPLPYEPYWT